MYVLNKGGASLGCWASCTRHSSSAVPGTVRCGAPAAAPCWVIERGPVSCKRMCGAPAALHAARHAGAARLRPRAGGAGLWVGDCFIYNNAAWRLNYCVGGEVTTMFHLDRPMYLLGYLASQSRVYLIDKARRGARPAPLRACTFAIICVPKARMLSVC